MFSFRESVLKVADFFDKLSALKFKQLIKERIFWKSSFVCASALLGYQYLSYYRKYGKIDYIEKEAEQLIRISQQNERFSSQTCDKEN